MKKPEKINREDNEKAIEQGNTVRAHRTIRQWFNILLEGRAYGSEIEHKGFIAQAIYEPAPTLDYLTKTERKSKNEVRNYGALRIENITNVKRLTKMTYAECKFLHYYFWKMFGEQWTSLVTFKDLATNDINITLAKGRRAGLVFPNNLTASAVLGSLAANFHSGLSIGIREWRSKLGSKPDSNRENFEYEGSINVLPVQHEYLIDVAGIEDSGSSNLFVFESSDRPMKLKGSEEKVELFPTCIIQPQSDMVEIAFKDHKNTRKQPFEIMKYLGGFNYYALIFPKDWKFVEAFGVNSDWNSWSIEMSKVFVDSLHQRLIQHPDSMQIATYAYEVE